MVSGLTKREINRDTVKLHMTLINAKRFDARQILDKYGQYEFGSQELHEIHIAIMRSTDTDGFYKCTTSISFWIRYVVVYNNNFELKILN